MKLTTVTHVSIDGVMQGLGTAEEDRRGGFARGGWALPLFDDGAEAAVGEIYQRADAFLFGRWTYEVFAGSWGRMPAESGPIADALNDRHKYVVSSTLTDPPWAPTTVLTGDVAAAVRDLKTSGDGELQVHGSGTLIRALLDHRLVDEITLLTYPVIVGQGTRLFPSSGPDAGLDLVGSRTVGDNGITLHVYRPAGTPKYAASAPRP